VLELLVKHTPKPDVPDSIRRLPPPRPSARAPRLEPASQPLSPLAAAGTVAPAPTRTTPGDVVPLSPERHKISFSASQRVRELLQQARDLRRHRYPSGDLEPLFEHALELLIAHENKRQCGQTATPRKQPTAAAAKPDSRYIPRALRRQVWARDGGQCRFIAPEGDRCQARSRLEFHHVVAFARGGPTREDNIVLLCRAHNALMAERDYGRSFVQARIASSASGVIRGLETLPP
jgi:5-methylcytosine-specific restriction endonuclease McrA